METKEICQFLLLQGIGSLLQNEQGGRQEGAIPMSKLIISLLIFIFTVSLIYKYEDYK